MTYQPTALENAAAESVPSSDELLGGFERLEHPAPATTEEREAKMAKMLFGKDYWTRVINFEAMAEEGVINEADLDLFHWVETAEEGWARIVEFYELDCG